ncbi:hypothetical protein [Georgenia wutianyii]|uniref:hypothetical protein n=1 Tax=Georgenia wutianyii TaxID=2585135 RepID=UPI00143D6E44|nr:hypothetical protein [Georgenia wutianyii]
MLTIGLGETPRLREGKLTPDGRPTYASGTILMTLRGGEVKADKTASVHVVEPAEAGYELGQKYAAQGRVWVMPYENNSRVALSITVERLVAVSAHRESQS